MAEFVERESLLERLKEYCKETCKCAYLEDAFCVQCYMNDAIIIVAERDVINDTRLKYGRWHNLSGVSEVCGEKMYRCTICREDFWMTSYSAKHIYKHCPNCGAKMEGVYE